MGIMSYKAHFRVMLKSGQNWRQIMSINNINACGITKGLKALPFLEDGFNWYKNSFPNLPAYCPIHPKNYSGQFDIHIGNKYENNDKQFLNQFTPDVLPNGVFRYAIKMYNNEDSNIFSIIWQTERYIRLNDDVF